VKEERDSVENTRIRRTSRKKTSRKRANRAVAGGLGCLCSQDRGEREARTANIDKLIKLWQEESSLAIEDHALAIEERKSVIKEKKLEISMLEIMKKTKLDISVIGDEDIPHTPLYDSYQDDVDNMM